MKQIIGTIAGLAGLAAIGKINNIIIRSNAIKGMRHKIETMYSNNFIDTTNREKILTEIENAPDWDTLRQINSELIDPMYREYTSRILNDIVN